MLEGHLYREWVLQKSSMQLGSGGIELSSASICISQEFSSCRASTWGMVAFDMVLVIGIRSPARSLAALAKVGERWLDQFRLPPLRSLVYCVASMDSVLLLQLV